MTDVPQFPQTGPIYGQISLFAAGEMHSVELRESITVGRGRGNKVRLRDDLISRRHCRISPSETGVVLEDLDSRNGTWLNGSRVKTAALNPGDVIDVGRCTLFFTVPEKNSHYDFPVTGNLEACQDIPRENQTVPGMKTPSLASPPPVGVDELAGIVRDRNNLLHLQQIMKTINSEVDPDKTFERIIDSAVELTNARRGFLVVPDRGSFAVAYARGPETQDGQDHHGPDRRVVLEALHEGLTIRSEIRTGGIERSVLCVPCLVVDEVIGALYLDAPAVAKVFDGDDEKIITTFSDQAGIVIKNVRFNVEMKEKRALEKELDIAGQIQRHLFPPGSPSLSGLRVYGESVPATEVGGDYYDFIPDPEGGGCWACIADVSGKGISAGLIMVMARSILRTLVGRYPSTLDTLMELNRTLRADLENGRFISMTLLHWDPKRRVLRYASAGHEHVLLYHAKENRCERIPAGGAVLGIPWDNLLDRFHEKEIALGPGDQVLLYTDGVTDARNEEDQFFGLLRLQRIVETQGKLGPDQLVWTILEKVSEFMGPTPQPDDITLIAMQGAPEDA